MSVQNEPESAAGATQATDVTADTSEKTFPVVGIGASAGGLKALERFFQHLPDASGMAFVIVQHLAPDYKSELVMLLQRHTSMTVAQVREGVQVQPNTVYVIPPNKVLTIDDSTLRLTQRHRQVRQQGPIDIFFSSLAAAQTDRAVAIVLSGTGSDGAIGVKAVKEHGGITMAQTPDDAEYDGMPRSAIATNCVDLVGSAKELAARLVGYCESVRKIPVPPADTSFSTTNTSTLHQILSLLHETVGHDFTNYKESTILRRIGRRMRINDVDNMADYLQYLRQTPAEHNALFRDFLISVTNFFRDPEAFHAVQKLVIQKLIAEKSPTEQLRIWVPGCASGEEAYSLAMLLNEAMEAEQVVHDIQIFATDLDQEALSFAQRGFYNDAIVGEVPGDRLLRHFTKASGGYQIKKALREQILFANHNLISDPPFSRLDFISCRNLLIYLDRELQEKILELFHYALLPGGYLLLGTSESTDVATDLFTALDKKQRIFQRQEVVAVQPHRFVTAPRRQQLTTVGTREPQPNVRTQVAEQYQQWRLQQYTPPALLVDSNYNLIYLFGDAGRYVQMKEGPASLNILDGVLPAFRLNLRTALYDAFQHGVQTTTPIQQVDIDGERSHVRLQVGPVAQEGVPDGLTEVVFEEYPTTLFPHAQPHTTEAAERNTLAERLEEELVRTKERLQTTVEEYELNENTVLTRDVVEMPGAVAVAVLNDNNELLMLNQYRHPVRMNLWEVPAGLLDIDGEDPLVAA
ncbi:MAG TPA: chemotaxis protein CheB, partial [Caldilineaceae bacterium]|nr:chemotaxis protein CheB [Caldilineaceae bacterium]